MKWLPISLKNWIYFSFVSQLELSTKIGLVLLFEKSKTFLKTFLILFIFLFISCPLSIFLVESLPEGSPISVVPPPN